jgi:Terminase large subunit, T4likevirus-type, N-terminal
MDQAPRIAEPRKDKPTETVIWTPQERQAQFIQCPADDVGFGGARGGGKSDAVLGDWIAHESRYGKDAIGLVIRRERTQLVELIERAKSIYLPLGYVWREVDKAFAGPKGGRLRFAYCENDSDAEAYQGWSVTRLYVEEATTFPSEAPINKLQAILRSGVGVRPQMKVTCNPGGAGHGWVKARYCLDSHPQGMEVFRFNWKNPFTGKTIEKTRIFIPSKVSDNAYLGEDYVANLYQVGTNEQVKGWLEGDWSIVQGSFFGDCWSVRNIVAPFAIPEGWLRFRSIDWGSMHPFSVGWWAVASEDTTTLQSVIPRGALIRYREWYGAAAPDVGLKMTVEEVAEGVVRRSRDEKYAYTVCDPSMFASSGGPSLAERLFHYPRFGIVKPGDNERVSRSGSPGKSGAMGGWDAMRQRLRGDGEKPMLFVFTTCRDFLRTIPSLTHDIHKAEDIDTNSEDHIADETRYACMSRPWIAKIPYVGTAGVRADGTLIETHKRNWKVLSEMTYDEVHEALRIYPERKRERV